MDLGSMEEYLGLVLLLINMGLGALQVPFMQFLKVQFPGLEDRKATFTVWGMAIFVSLLGMFLANQFVGLAWTFEGIMTGILALRTASETVFKAFVQEKR